MHIQSLPPDRKLNRELQIVEYPSFEKLRSFAGHSTAVFHMCLDPTGRSAFCAASSSRPLTLMQQNLRCSKCTCPISGILPLLQFNAPCLESACNKVYRHCCAPIVRIPFF